MSAFRILVDVRMQYSFRHAAAVVLAAPVLNLRSASHGFMYLAAEGPAGFLWVRTHFCGYAGIAVTSLAVVDRSAVPHGRGGAGRALLHREGRGPNQGRDRHGPFREMN